MELRNTAKTSFSETGQTAQTNIGKDWVRKHIDDKKLGTKISEIVFIRQIGIINEAIT